MRVATLQFAPRLGKVEANIRRADEVLSRAMKKINDARKPLDILVLPEMAFSGKMPCSNFEKPLIHHCKVVPLLPRYYHFPVDGISGHAQAVECSHQKLLGNGVLLRAI